MWVTQYRSGASVPDEMSLELNLSICRIRRLILWSSCSTRLLRYLLCLMVLLPTSGSPWWRMALPKKCNAAASHLAVIRKSIVCAAGSTAWYKYFHCLWFLSRFYPCAPGFPQSFYTDETPYPATASDGWAYGGAWREQRKYHAQPYCTDAAWARYNRTDWAIMSAG